MPNRHLKPDVSKTKLLLTSRPCFFSSHPRLNNGNSIQSVARAKSPGVILVLFFPSLPTSNQQNLLALHSHYLKSDCFSHLPHSLGSFWVLLMGGTSRKAESGNKERSGAFSPAPSRLQTCIYSWSHIPPTPVASPLWPHWHWALL